MSVSRYFYSGVFLISLCLMALQVLQSRIFSVTTWYHLAFLVISIAMFGMTLAALHIHRGDERTQRERYAEMMADGARMFGIFVLIALLAQLFIPIIYSSALGTLLTLPVLSLFTVLPFYYAGIVLTLALTRSPYPVSKTYGIDLIGAAAGCLCVLLLMRFMDAPSAILFLVLLAFTASICFARATKKPNKGSRFGTAVFITAAISLIINLSMERPFIYPFWVKSHFITQDALSHDQWNTISRVTVTNEIQDTAPFLWGASPMLPEDMRTSYHFLTIDGDAGTPINAFDGDLGKIAFLNYDVTTIAYALPGIEKAAIIGIGGGRDALSAHYFGAREITALDVNNIPIDLLTKAEPFRSYAGLHNLPGLRLINSEARSWFARNREKFDLIQMSLIDTWAATGAGAFALSENGLYTVEAWNLFLDDLSENGYLTVSRWYTDDARNETERLLALAVQALLEYGITKPRDHIALITGGQVATLIISKSPFTNVQIETLLERAKQRAFTTLLSPLQDSSHDMFNQIVNAPNATTLTRISNGYEFDISPPYDDRPFFFNQVRLADPIHTIRLVIESGNQAILGHAKATLNLYIILGFAFFMVVFAILLPLRSAIRGSEKPYIAAGTSWFLLIGLGFMLLEIALLQRMSIFLGHPVYGLGVVLFSLVFFTGLGSLLAGRIQLLSSTRRNIWIVTTALLALILSVATGPIFSLFSESALFLRGIVCVMLAMPLGILLGFGFPTGMALVQAIDPRPSAWFWGINGAAGVMGSAVAVALNIAIGLNWTIIIGGLCYALLLIPSLVLGTQLKNNWCPTPPTPPDRS